MGVVPVTVRVAMPPTTPTAEPMSVVPSLENCTVPVRFPIPVRVVTVAVNVTLSPLMEGLRLLVTTVDVVALVTTWITGTARAGGEVGVTAVDRGDRVAAGAEVGDDTGG